MNKFVEKLKGISIDKKALLKDTLRFLLMALPFAIMDILIRVMAMDVSYFQKKMVMPSILFSVIWILLFIFLSMSFKKNLGRVIYGLFFTIFFLVFVTNCVYFPYTDFFFSFNLLLLASEGSSYILDTILSTPFINVLAIIASLVLGIISIVQFPKREKHHWRGAIIVVVLFIIAHMFVPSLYGKANGDLEWDTWRNPRNVYANFNDANKSMKVCGMYEYAIRDFYMTFLKPAAKIDPAEMEFLENAFANPTQHEANEYTGMFEGKNVIFLQLEGIDSWLLTEETMPNLYGMLDHSLVFENHYSYYNGGGSTFNSELAVNTGLITPISYIQNAYTFSSNLYIESMPKLFYGQGYDVNAFHMNKGEYYSRRLNYQNWGYSNYYGLLDEKSYSDITYELDRELIENESFYEKMFQTDHKFVHYLITYTPHTPYNTDGGKGKYLAAEIYGADNVPDMGEEECARLYAAETDRMIGLLLQALEDNGLAEDTVIVAYADHYLYTLTDKTILDQYKQTDSNLINHTPFFIYNKGMEQQVVEKVNSQVDILPTVLNLFGITYTEENYIGNDIFDESYNGYVFFSDYSWYDGNVYVENGLIVNGAEAEQEYVQEMNVHINELIQKNDLILKYDYFRK